MSTLKLAMWSGPRNLSTALMYSFANRPDFEAVDEPFYASYLHQTGLAHPMRDAVIAAQPTDPHVVIDDLIKDRPRHYYQKHMTQHMIATMPLGWLEQVTNVFLIRHPHRVLSSFAAKYDRPTLDDVGFYQQAKLFDYVLNQGQTPIVIDSADIRNDPKGMLTKLCAALGIPFHENMLTWPKGPKPYDGVWAPHWYGAVHHSTGFAGPEGDLPTLRPDLHDIAEQCMVYYKKMQDKKI